MLFTVCMLQILSYNIIFKHIFKLFNNLLHFNYSLKVRNLHSMSCGVLGFGKGVASLGAFGGVNVDAEETDLNSPILPSTTQISEFVFYPMENGKPLECSK